jgi:flavin-dependent dehydrogenase
VITTDVVVCGAGPAGCSAAVILGDMGWSTVVIHGKDPTNWHPTESVSTEALDRVRRLLRTELPTVAVPLQGHGTDVVWGDVSLQHTEQQPATTIVGAHLNRTEFDHTLRVIARSHGARFLRGTHCHSLRRKRGWWHVHVQDVHVRARFLVLATGRNSGSFAQHLPGRKILHDRLVALCANLPCDPPHTDGRLIIESQQSGYCYALETDSHHVTVCALTDSDLLAQNTLTPIECWRSMLANSPEITERFHLHDVTPQTFSVRSARSTYLTPFAGSHWIAVGDAASSHDPIFGAGVDHAVASGIAAAQTMDALLRGDASATQRYTESLTQQYQSYLHNRRVCYLNEPRWNDQVFWKRRNGIDPHKVAFETHPETIVRLGDVSSERADTLSAMEALLPYNWQTHLREAVRQPCPLFQVGLALKALWPPTPDQDLVAALEMLMTYGALVRAS